ncbi:DUF5655 domain-containing protein [Aeromicrobium sp.]
MIADPQSPEEFFDGSAAGLAILRAVESFIESICGAEVDTSKSQIAFRLRKGFAYVWRPDRYLRSEVPAVLSIPLPRRLDSPRFKEIVQPSPGIWMHHIELREADEVDAEVSAWLQEARAAAA